ncbi:MAG: manganese/zinc/iron transport system substrate-binding protein [Pseudorhodobacter sp.]|jgi:manganese/zinc/iron transport system substrate-binding protein
MSRLRIIRKTIDFARHSHYLRLMDPKTHPHSVSRRTLLGLLPGLALSPSFAFAAAAPRIVATTGMIADAARRISGLEVTALMGPGVDPHSYRQTRSDIAALVRADLVLWHGLRLEAQLVDLMQDLSRRQTVVAVAEAVDKDRLLSWAGYADHHDPHVWMDPMLWLAAVTEVEAALITLMPERRAELTANAAAYKTEITVLDAYTHKILSSVPQNSRVLVTAHDAFSYFGRAYGFEVEGLQGISTESEAGLARIGALVDLLVQRGIRAVFVESSVPDRAMRALVEGAAAQGHRVQIGGELFSDAMGVEGSYEGTYPGMIDHNVTLIAQALGGDAPARGLSGQLAAGA